MNKAEIGARYAQALHQLAAEWRQPLVVVLVKHPVVEPVGEEWERRGVGCHLAEEEVKGPLEERVELLQQWVAALGELDKALMILYLEERSYREIAEILGITETNVGTKLGRLKERLKKQLIMLNN